MKPEHSDPVWELLARAREVRVRDGFASELADLARRSPQDGADGPDLMPAVRRRGTIVSFLSSHPWQSGLAAAAAVAILAIAALRHEPQGSPGLASGAPGTPPAAAQIAASDGTGDAIVPVPSAGEADTSADSVDLLELMFERSVEVADAAPAPSSPALPELENALTELEDVHTLLAVEDPEMLEELDEGLLAALLF